MNSMALRRFDMAQNALDRTGESQRTLEEMSQNCMRYRNEAYIAKEAAIEAHTEAENLKKFELVCQCIDSDWRESAHRDPRT